MNNELIAHGWSNGLSGLAFGLQNYMTYSNSVVYAKSSGKGRVSSIAVAALTVLIFIWGPIIAAHVPRCIAGTLLFHLGVDLFMEGVIDSYHDYDRLEYGGCWLITISMVALGMDAGLVAGAVAALATFAAQSIINQYPVKGCLTASTLRSSAWNRSLKAEAILNDREKGRQRILIVQLEGHIFFGNSTTTMDHIKRLIEKPKAGQEPFVLILDFSQVVGIDSTAAHAIAKLKDSLLKKFALLDVILFVTRDEGFPCDFALATRVCESDPAKASIRIVERRPGSRLLDGSDSTSSRMSITARAFKMNHIEPAETIAEIPNSRVFRFVSCTSWSALLSSCLTTIPKITPLTASLMMHFCLGKTFYLRSWIRAFFEKIRASTSRQSGRRRTAWTRQRGSCESCAPRPHPKKYTYFSVCLNAKNTTAATWSGDKGMPASA